MNLNTLKDLYVDALRDLYDAENQILKALPKMAKAASSAELQGGFYHTCSRARATSNGLIKCLSLWESQPDARNARPWEGLLEEGKELLESDSDPEVLDARHDRCGSESGTL